ncbi:IS3 family transposase [Herbaspirillum huttiense]
MRYLCVLCCRAASRRIKSKLKGLSPVQCRTQSLRP